jgi:hypothetical protein
MFYTFVYVWFYGDENWFWVNWFWIRVECGMIYDWINLCKSGFSNKFKTKINCRSLQIIASSRINSKAKIGSLCVIIEINLLNFVRFKWMTNFF